MEDNAYNRNILKKLLMINKEYLDHLKKTGKEILESEQVPLTKPLTKYEGGDGLKDFLVSTFGGSKPKGLGRPKKGGIIKTSSSLPIARAVGSGEDIEGAGFFDDVLDVVKTVAPVAMMALGKTKGRGHPKKGGFGVDSMAEQKNLLTGNGKKRGRPSKKDKDLKEAGGWFDDMVDGVSKGFNMVVDPALKIAKTVVPLMKGGKKRKESPWIAHCKEFSKKHNMKYSECLKDPKCRSSYKKK